MTDTARERALKRNAEAAGVEPDDPNTSANKRYVAEKATVRLAESPVTVEFWIVVDTSTATAVAFPKSEEAARERASELNTAYAKHTLGARVTNQAASRGDVVEIGKQHYVVVNVAGLEAGWGYNLFLLKGFSRTDPVKMLGGETYTTTREAQPLQPVARWLGRSLEEGARGKIELPEDNTNSGESRKEEHSVPTITRKKGAKKASANTTKKAPAAKATTNGGSAKTRRSAEEVAALVPKFRKHLTDGGTMRQLKEEFGFSDDGPIRAALYRAGFDSKGQPHGVEANDLAGLSPAKMRDRLVKERSAGAGWYVLAYRTGMTESEIKKIIAEAGGAVTGRVYISTDKPAKAKPAAKPAAEKKAPAAKAGKATTAKAKPAAKRTVKATKANPSSQA